MQLALALVLAAQASPWVPPGTRSAVEVEALIRAEDCSASRCDWSPALERAQQLLDDVPSPQFSVSPPGGVINLPCGAGDLSKPIVLRRGHVLRGCGGTFPSCATLINVRTSTHGIVAMRNASGFVLRDFCLNTLVAAERIDRHALVIGGRGEIEEVSLRGGFVDGYHIYGNVNTQTNVNGMKIRGGRVDLMERAAVWVAGADGNANTFDSIDVGSNCQRGTKWGEPIGVTDSWSIANGIITIKLTAPAAVKAGYFLAFDTPTPAGRLREGGQVTVATPSGAATTIQIRHPGANGGAVEPGRLTQPCANVVDLAFLNNTWTAVQTARATDRVTGEVFRSFIFGNPASGALCLGCYAEMDQLPGFLSASSTAIGGVGAWEGPGLRMLGPRASGLIVTGSPLTPGGPPPELRLGSYATLPGTVLLALPPNVPNAPVPANVSLRLRLDDTPTSWFLDLGGAGNGVAMRVLGDPTRWAKTTIRSSTKTVP